MRTEHQLTQGNPGGSLWVRPGVQTPNSLFISRKYHLFILHSRSTVNDEIWAKVLVCELLVFRVCGIKRFCLIRGISVVTYAIQVIDFLRR